MKSSLTEETFRGHVGPAKIHDATVLRVERTREAVTVRLRSCAGDPFALVFPGAFEVRALRPEGMLLYALAELRTDRPRLYAFQNADDEAEEFLEVRATGFHERKDPLPRFVRRLARPLLGLFRGRRDARA